MHPQNGLSFVCLFRGNVTAVFLEFLCVPSLVNNESRRMWKEAVVAEPEGLF
jgi:hypothetical protein